MTMLRILSVAITVLFGLHQALCAGTATDCGTSPADIVFLMDSSGSVGTANFQKQKDFVAKFAQSFTIGPHNVQIGVVTFATRVHNEFNLNTFHDKQSLVNAIHGINYVAGMTYTNLALQYVERNSFTPAAGDRPNVANILIVMTDGRSTNAAQTIAETQKLHQMNLKVFAIGIGSGVSRPELEQIASDSKHVFLVNNFDALTTLQAELKNTTCTVDGGWTTWGSYSPCTRSCGGGTHFRERSCTNPRPAHGGKACVGATRETNSCNTGPCPTVPTTVTTTVQACNGTQPADILFILDASGSVGSTDFQKMLTFVQRMVSGFRISPTEIQVGLMTFDSSPYLQFHFNRYGTKTAATHAIMGTKYTGGGTTTSKALQYARQNMFQVTNGMRPNAAHIAIIITDGQSDNEQATLSEATQLKGQGVTVFAIGVGSGPRQSELHGMATPSWQTHTFTVTNYNALDRIKATLQQKTCEAATTTTSTTQMPTTTPACFAQADIVFLLDSSGSVGSTNFQKMLGFVRNVANNFNIGPSGVQIGVDTFQTSHKAEFYLNTYSTKQPMLTAINNIKYQPGLTHTGEAIRFMATDSFSSAHGDRPNVPNVAIIVTDGQSNNPALTAAEAKKARDQGITLLALGVGHGIGKTELNEIATDPDSSHVYTADNFDALASLQAFVSDKACEVSKPKVTSAPVCTTKADIVFILDSSGSIGQANYDKMLTFVKDLVSNFDVGPNKIRIGAEIFSDRTYIQFNLNKYQTKADVENAITNIPYKRGTTNTGQALKDAYSKMFTAANGDRAGVPNIAIVVTDGQSTNRLSTLREAKNIQNNGIQVFAVGVGSGVDKTELNAIATDPDNTHVLTVQNFQQLKQIQASLNTQACNAIPPSPLSPVAGTTQAPDPCPDQNPDCGSYEIPGVCSDYADWARDNCQKSCGLCSNSVPTIPPPCVDRLSDCSSYDLSTCSGHYKGWAENNCRKYCGFCDMTSPKQVFTGYFGRCYYKGQEHRQGETWDDGCSYECTCDDATQGRYSCYNKCPVYYNLPPQCVLIKKGNGCCLEPVCNFQAHHGTTSGQGTGKLNGVDVCMYKNQPYYQGQTWQDGCDHNCYCQDGRTGLYTCTSVCGTYSNLPPHCHLEKPAGKCCSEPVCDFNKQFGHFTGSGTTSGHGGGAQSLTTVSPQACVDKAPNCNQYQKDTCTNPQFTAWANDNCKKYCGLCNVTPTPGPNDKCVYKGVGYSQGQKWDDGCDLECVCENAAYGFYRCNKKCADMTNLPIGCTMVKKPGECCSSIQCQGQTGTFQGSQTQPGTIGGYPVPPLAPTAAPTPGPGLTFAPGQIPQVIPQAGGKLAGCVYKGVLHQTGMRWDDGCSYTCICMDGSTGQFRCTGKCPVFNNLPSECHMQDNPQDPCCQQPVCTPGSSGSISSVPVPTYGKGFTGYNLPQTPNIGTGMGPGAGGTGTGPIPGTGTSGTGGIVPVTGATVTGGTGPGTGGTGPGTGGTGPGTGGTGPNIVNPNTGSGSVCVYKGSVYGQGATWNDQCTYVCECTDASTGQYRCQDRCPIYQNIPSQCSLVQDPQDPCCKTITCGSYVTTTPFHIFPQTTPPAGSAYCEYKGDYHRQGETWNDGCGLTCRCEDAIHQYYQCTDRCPKYTGVPVTCSFVPDPRDPQCCSVPSCPGTGTGTSGFGPSGTGTGSGPSGTGTSGFGPSGTGTGSGPSGQITSGSGPSGQGTPAPGQTGSGTSSTGTPAPGQTGTGISGTGPSGSGTPAPGQTGTGTSGSGPSGTGGTGPGPSGTGTSGSGPSGVGVPQSFKGSFTGYGRPPNFSPGSLAQTGYSNACLYKGNIHQQGESWDDGCDYKCTCTDAAKGMYTCTERCSRIANVPSGCRIIVDPDDSCCQKLACNPILTQCQDVANCNLYGAYVCEDPYKQWAAQNCAKYCGICGGGTKPVPTIPGPCLNAIPNCDQYGKGACVGQYVGWAKANCPFYCHLCPGQTGIGTGIGTGTGGTSGPGTGTGGTINGTGTVPGTGGTVVGTGGTINGTGTVPGTGGIGVGTGGTISGTGGGPCQDVLDNCPAYTQAACKDPYVDWARHNCAAYCGFCGSGQTGIGTGTGTMTGGTGIGIGGGFNGTGSASCHDVLGNCLAYTQAACKDPYVDWARHNCAAYCGFCGSGQTGIGTGGGTMTGGTGIGIGGGFNGTGSASCHDVLDNCPAYTQAACKDPYVDWAKKNCAAYCGLCGLLGGSGSGTGSGSGYTFTGVVTQQPGSFTGASGGCTYKGRYYGHGDQWEDGCDYNCTCVNGQTGFYRCIERCLHYNYMPAGCVLKKPPGECCAVPDCSGMTGGGTGTGTGTGSGTGGSSSGSGSGGSVVMTGDQPGCFFKNHLYQQDETWKDGCTYKCTCVDAKSHRYSCQGLCLTFQLPNTCHMDPPPEGKCCQIPVCPSNVIISYPPGYVLE